MLSNDGRRGMTNAAFQIEDGGGKRKISVPHQRVVVASFNTEKLLWRGHIRLVQVAVPISRFRPPWPSFVDAY
jgi:hypothetical protein